MTGSLVNLIIAGVGGQGNVLTSQIIGRTAVACGWKVASADTFGVSQRGGSVVSHLRLASQGQYGPLVPPQRAHIILGLEPLETARALRTYGHPGTKLLFNPRPNFPLAVLIREASYPDLHQLLSFIRSYSSEVREIPAGELAETAGTLLAQNVVMTGALAGTGWLPFATETYKNVLHSIFGSDPSKSKKLDLNLGAFELGYEAAAKAAPKGQAGKAS